MDKKELWESVLTDLQLSISAANFQTWFKGNTEIVNLENSLINIGCSSQYVKDWLEQRYLGQLKAILDRLTENSNSLSFVVSNNFTTEKTNKPKKVEPITETLFDNQDSGKLSEKVSKANLNPNYGFESYVVAGSNQLAFSVAQSIVEQPGSLYNPFFVYGGVGLGKTHLIQGVGNELLRKNPKIKIYYASSESFTNSLMEAIQQRKTKEMRDKFRSVDVLIIDDIQFIAGRESTQEEFFHTFNDLHGKGKQVILSSDREPSQIAKLEDRLKSRFAGGMIADIQPPDTEMREAILVSKIHRQNLDIPEDVIRYLARSIATNVRDLEGSLLRIVTQAKVSNSTLSLELAKSFIDQRSNRSLAAKVAPKEVIDLVCTYFNLRQSDLKGTTRIAKVVLPRQITMYLLRTDLGIQYESIAKELGGRDHSTVMHGVEKIEQSVEKSDEIRGLVADIRAKLYN
jgi:chromosomal replication initiator protein